MKKILKTALSGIIIMGIFATSFIMPVSAEETSTSSNDTITVFEKDLSTGENTTNEIQIADNDNIKQMLIFLKQIKMISKLIIILSVHIILLVTMTESLLNHRIRGLLYLKALLKIHYPDGRVLNGTAWIFAKRALMTAGHCIHNNSYGGTATKLPVALSIDEFKGDTNCENYQCILTDPVNTLFLICGNLTLIFHLFGLKMLLKLLINIIGFGKLSGLLRLFENKSKRSLANPIADILRNPDSF